MINIENKINKSLPNLFGGSLFVIAENLKKISLSILVGLRKFKNLVT
jgi:hypothetical protein